MWNLVQLQELFEGFSLTAGVASAVIDLDGQILVGARWQRICTEYHRAHPVTASKCLESDTSLATDLVRAGGDDCHTIYRCKNGLTDAAAPVFIEGEHVANVFVGQFLTEPPQVDVFRKQARDHGFDEGDYLEALAEVPVVSPDRLPAMLSFLSRFAAMLGALAINEINRREDAERLRASEERFRALAESSLDTIMRFDREGRHLYVNPIVEEQTGIAPADFIGKTHSELGFPPHLVELWDGAIQKVIETGEPNQIEFALPNDIWIDWLLVPELDETGQVKAVMTSARDFTERKHAEVQRKLLQEQYFRSQKMEAIGTLAGGVAHDMNNILGAIMGSASLIELEIEEHDPKLEDIRAILAACRRGSDLTRNLLGFARKGKYTNAPIDVSSVVTETVAILQRTIPKKISIHQSLSAALCPVQGDRSQVAQALLNVCLNAAEAVAEQGTIYMEAENTMVEEPGSGPTKELAPGRYVSLTVRDTGKGMDQDTVDRAIEPFFSTKPKGKGSGLGLSMAFGMAANHGGVVAIDSALGRGTTVTMILPASLEREAHQVSQMADERPAPDTTRVILVVDDEDLIRRVAARSLKRIGFEVLLASDGQAALEVVADEERIDLVILDLVMPRMDGPETFRALRASNPELKVLISSGYALDEKVEALLTGGAVGFVQKPFDLKQLQDAIDAALA